MTTDLLVTLLRDLGSIVAGLFGSCYVVYLVFHNVKSEE
jgi:hypothetical protein